VTAPLSLARWRAAFRARDDGNAFIPIAPGWRWALLAYFFVYLAATPVLQELALPSHAPLARTRLAMEVVLQTLAFLPIFFYRPTCGWLHPLLFPTLYALANDVLRSPGELLRPLQIGRVPLEPVLRIDQLAGYSEEAVARGDARLVALRILALLAYYAGFFVLARTRRALPARWVAREPGRRRVRAVAGTVAAAVLLGLVLFLVQRGGLQAHLAEYWGGGRGDAGSAGAVALAQSALDLAVVALMLWYALEPGAPRNPFFAGAVGATLALQFLVSGSRSNLFYAVTLFVVLWMLRHRRVPVGRVLLLAAVMLVLLGPMGDFRRAVRRTGEVDWGVLVNLKGAVSRTTREFARRASRGGGVPVMIRVPREVGYLRGRTYVGGVLFFVPRAVWKGKPRGVAYYNARLNFGRKETVMPIPPAAEAYWNFGVPGVAVIFLLFGAFHRGLASWFARHGHHPVLWVPYVLALFYLVPSSTVLTTGARAVAAALLLLAAMGAWTRAGPRPAGAPAPGEARVARRHGGGVNWRRFGTRAARPPVTRRAPVPAPAAEPARASIAIPLS
jgi:hypothetical protein